MRPTPTYVGKKTRRAAPPEDKTRSLSRSQTPTTALSSSEETARASTSPRASASTPSTPQLAREAIASGPERFTLPQPNPHHHRTGSWSLSASRESHPHGAGKPCTDTAAPTPRTAPPSAQQQLLGGDSPPIRKTGEGSGVSFQVLRCDELPQWKHPIVQLALQWLEGAQTMEAVRLLTAVASSTTDPALRRHLLGQIKRWEPHLILVCRQWFAQGRAPDALLLLDAAMAAASNHHFPFNLLKALTPQLIPLARQATALRHCPGIGRAIRLLAKPGWWMPQQPCYLDPAVRSALLALGDWASVVVALDQEVSERLGQPVQACGPDGIDPLLDALETLFHGADEHQDKPLMLRVLGWTQYLASHGASALASQAERLQRHERLHQRCGEALRERGDAIPADPSPPPNTQPELASWRAPIVSARGPRKEPPSPVRLSGGGLRGSDPSSEKRLPDTVDGIETAWEQPIDRAFALKLCIEHAARTKTLQALLDHLQRWPGGPPTKPSLASLLDIAGQPTHSDAQRAALIRHLIPWLPASDPADAALHTACVTAILGLAAGEVRERCAQQYLAAFAGGAEKAMAQLFALSSDAHDIAARVTGLLTFDTH